MPNNTPNNNIINNDNKNNDNNNLRYIFSEQVVNSDLSIASVTANNIVKQHEIWVRW